MVNDFDDIRPYYDNEINDAMLRIVGNPYFEYIVNFLYPGVPVEIVKAKFRTFNSVLSFQVNVMNSAIQNIVKNSSSGFTYNGFENLDNSKRYVFLSNHRDILLDSALLQLLLHINDHDTSEITFGDNLMTSQLIIDIGKSNKMFRLVRGGTPKNIFMNSANTSQYIRYAISGKRQSVWIAQRNGRTKDGNDRTQQAVLKMLGMSGGRDFVQNFSQLSIAPVAISYEYDPGDFLKTKEIYISRRQTYVKSTGEDLNSILTGIKQNKGRIHLAVTLPVTEMELREIAEAPKNERIEKLAALIDSRIHSSFRIWNTNYIASDILYGNRFNKIYSLSEKDAFVAYMNKALSNIEGDRQELESIFLSIYANPVENFNKATGLNIQPEIKDLKQFESSL
jgi:hypothetical protein